MILVVLTLIQSAWACSCRTEEPAAALGRSSAVFEAQVQSREVLTQPDGQPRLELELAVAAWFKGDGGKTVSLHTSSPCALPAQVRQRWIIYATESEDRLRASLCSRSTRDVDTERKHLPDPFETWQLPAPPVTAHSAAEECDPASLEAIVSSGEPIHGGIQPFATCTDAQLPAMVAVMGQHKQAHRVGVPGAPWCTSGCTMRTGVLPA